ncbi:glycosyltransferase family 2 protein [Sphingobacterium thalpophilum]|uniref:Glycosyltransferase family 2 protein n=1 Tax=Sphingobacterium thalpophilum TaxID=259 RepID=A0ABV4HB76_9SPHI
MSEQRRKITIITVVYNDVKNIHKTIRSVLEQSFRNYEYIVIDGGSKDGTLELVQSYNERIDYILSEKDSGIYDAMNKGIGIASGEWLLFLNSGDLLFDSDILSKLDQFLSESSICPAVVYGDVEVLIPDQQIKKVVKCKSLDTIDRSMPFNHQSSLINAEVHKKNLYNLDFRIVADYNLFLGLYLKNEKFLYTGFAISTILAGGLSDSRRDRTFLEKKFVHDIYFPDRNNDMLYYWSILRFYISTYFKRLAPKSIVKKIYQNKYK